MASQVVKKYELVFVCFFIVCVSVCLLAFFVVVVFLCVRPRVHIYTMHSVDNIPGRREKIKIKTHSKKGLNSLSWNVL